MYIDFTRMKNLAVYVALQYNYLFSAPIHHCQNPACQRTPRKISFILDMFYWEAKATSWPFFDSTFSDLEWDYTRQDMYSLLRS